jgi:arsenate reductase
MSGIESYNVLFLCTGNSARSILAEAYLNSLRGRPFKAYSAGSHPAGAVNSHALDVLRTANIPVEGLRSKSWDEFAIPGAPKMHFVFTVCDNAAGEVCPIWPGQPMTAHWGIPDPAAVDGSDAEVHAAFFDAYRMLRNRIELFTALPLASIDRMSLQSKLDGIGRESAAPAEPAQ